MKSYSPSGFHGVRPEDVAYAYHKFGKLLFTRKMADSFFKESTCLLRGIAIGDPPAVRVVQEFDSWLSCGGKVPHTFGILPDFMEHFSSDDWYAARHIRFTLKSLWKLKQGSDTCVVSEEDAINQAALRLSTSGTSYSEWTARARTIVASLLGPAPNLLDLVPLHGPGSVSTGEKGALKWDFKRMPRQLLAEGGVDLLHLNSNHLSREPYPLELVDHPITKVIAVPKDVRSPRVISSESLEMMFLQQGLARYIMDKIHHSSHGRIKFTSQSDHRDVMLRYRLGIATLDLKDASDYVSRRLIWNLLPVDWRELVFSLRSRFARLPNQSVVPIRAFAPMGSALCFPLLSLAAYAATIIACRTNHHMISIYGDDVIVPVEESTRVMKSLNLFGLKVNHNKSCTETSRFRETCGLDLVFPDDTSKIDFTVPYVRDLSNKVSTLFSLESYYELCCSFGYRDTASHIISQWAAHYRGRSPLFSPTIVAEGIRKSPQKWHKGLQKLQTLSLQSVTKGDDLVPDSYPGIFASLTKRSESELRFPFTYNGYTVVKYGWVSVS